MIRQSVKKIKTITYNYSQVINAECHYVNTSYRVSSPEIQNQLDFNLICSKKNLVFFNKLSKNNFDLQRQILRYFSRHKHIPIRNPTYLDFFIKIAAFMILILFIQVKFEKVHFVKMGLIFQACKEIIKVSFETLHFYAKVY